MDDTKRNILIIGTSIATFKVILYFLRNCFKKRPEDNQPIVLPPPGSTLSDQNRVSNIVQPFTAQPLVPLAQPRTSSPSTTIVIDPTPAPPYNLYTTRSLSSYEAASSSPTYPPMVSPTPAPYLETIQSEATTSPPMTQPQPYPVMSTASTQATTESQLTTTVTTDSPPAYTEAAITTRS
ncbi:hypothetical protein FBU30_004124 [Linnemannia zychae]|nr:hypothetical protein FBU30_004124 [Linnemannia zychae]